MNKEIRYHVLYKENEMGCTVEDDNYGCDNYESAKYTYEYKKKNHEWVQLEKVTTEILETYEEPYPVQYGEKIKIIKNGLLYGAEGIVWSYNKLDNNVTIYFEKDDLKIDFSLDEIIKI